MVLDSILYVVAFMILYDLILHIYDFFFNKTLLEDKIFNYFSKGNKTKRWKIYNLYWIIYWAIAFILLFIYLINL